MPNVDAHLDNFLPCFHTTASNLISLAIKKSTGDISRCESKPVHSPVRRTTKISIAGYSVFWEKKISPSKGLKLLFWPLTLAVFNVL